METESYLELKVPISNNAMWQHELRKKLSGVPVKWQNAHYHITVAFFKKMGKEQLMSAANIIDGILVGGETLNLTIDKLDAFTTKSADMHIIYATSSEPDSKLDGIIKEVRNKLLASKFDIEEFKLHITLGRVSVDKISLKDLQSIISTVEMPSFTLKLSEFEYRKFRKNYKPTIKEWFLKLQS